MDQQWKAEFFGLDQVTAFTTAAPATQRAVVTGCSRAILEEAYFIEKAGVGFAAKMTLLAQDMDERNLYALFAGEEAAHPAAVHTLLGRSMKADGG